MEKFIILRKMSLETDRPFAGPLVLGDAGQVPASVQVEVADLVRPEIADVRRDPTVDIIAPSIEVRLIEPVERISIQPQAATGATWGVEAVGATQCPFTGQDVVIAVLDTGIDARHPAFQGVDLLEQDFTGEGDGDQNGHGTHCSGTIFGRSVGGLRIGVAPGVNRALIGKVLGQQGGGTTEMIFRAINWAIDHGANVISMSLGMDFPGFQKRLMDVGFPAPLATSKALQGYRDNVRLFERLSALISARFFNAQEVVLIAASGNESRRDLNPEFEIAAGPPAAAEGILAVGAVRRTDNQPMQIGYFSNAGVAVVAPGVDIASAAAGSQVLTMMSGTSMATPHVAGVAALWAQKQLMEDQRISAEQLMSQLKGRAQRMSLDGSLDFLQVGHGLVQAPSP